VKQTLCYNAGMKDQLTERIRAIIELQDEQAKVNEQAAEDTGDDDPEVYAQALRHCNERLRAAMQHPSQWISVEDSLPAKGLWLVYGSSETSPPTMRVDEYDGEWGWTGPLEVTHWRALPLPPAEPCAHGYQEHCDKCMIGCPDDYDRRGTGSTAIQIETWETCRGVGATHVARQPLCSMFSATTASGTATRLSS
jgi:hypothetical protein